MSETPKHHTVLFVAASEQKDYAEKIEQAIEPLDCQLVCSTEPLSEAIIKHQAEVVFITASSCDERFEAKYPAVVLITEPCDNQQLVLYYQQGISEVLFTPLHVELLARAVKLQLQQVESAITANEYQLQKTKMNQLGELVSLVSHEVASPLGNINTAVSFLLESSGVVQDSYDNKKLAATELERFLARLNRALTMSVKNGGNASNIITSFRTIATNQCLEKLNQFYLHRYIDDVILSLKSKLKNLPHEFHVVIGESVEMVSYSGVIAQIMIALIDKSVSHGFDDKVPGKIIISALVKTDEHGNERVMLNYMDDGRGMPEHAYQQLFKYNDEIFPNRDDLSMAMIKWLVENKLKGTMTVTSVVDEGVSITFNLPQKLS